MMKIPLLALSLMTILPSCSHGYSAAAPYCLNLKCQVKESRRDEFLQLIADNQQKTLADEPDALQYVVGEDIDTRNVFYIHEQFRSAAAFTYHRDTPHNANWHKFKASDPFATPPVASFYHGTHAAAVEKVPVRSAVVFCLNVQLDVQAEYRDEFLRVIENNAQNSNHEPLCLQYHYGEDELLPHTFHFHEQYTGADGGKEGFDAHTKTAHFQVWEDFAQAGNPFTLPPTVQMYRTLPPNILTL
jgi:quinol monooxygenase YgiN